MDKITRKAMPFIEAEVAGILGQEQEAVALANNRGDGVRGTPNPF